MRAATGRAAGATFRGGQYVATLMAELERAAISGRIKQAREQAGLTQHELADAMHVHWRTVQQWEASSAKTVPFDRLDELAAVTSVTKQWFLHGTQPVAEIHDQQLTEILRRLESLETAVAELPKGDEVQRGLDALRAAIDAQATQRTRQTPKKAAG